MVPRDTTTGHVLEATVIPALNKGGYETASQVLVGKRPGGGRHFVDVVATKGGVSHLVSLKWQQTSGTAEQKVPYEVICLIKALEEADGVYRNAYIVLGGSGWTLRDFYVRDGLTPYMKADSRVTIFALEDFLARANKSAL